MPSRPAVPLEQAHPHRHSSMGAPSIFFRDSQLEIEERLTGKGDVESPLPRGVVGLKLKSGHMATAGDGGGELVS